VYFLRGVYAQRLTSIFAVAIALYHIYMMATARIDIYTHRVISVLSLQLLIFLTTDAFKTKGKATLLLNLVTGAAWVIVTIFFMMNVERFAMHMVGIDPVYTIDIVLAGIFLVLVLECARRAASPWLALVGLVFALYVFVAPYLPGIFHSVPTSFERFIERMVFSTDGVFGIPVGVSSSYVFLFVTFGQFLDRAGGRHFFYNFASALTGTAKGGPAKVSVIASALFGTISGSPAADVVTTGSFTIPAMKKTGLPPYFAGAVEAVASTGGSFVPPVMGSVAFLMAEFLGISYLKIIVAAILPALLYYVGIYSVVFLEAERRNLTGFSREEIPPLFSALKYGASFFGPLGAIVALLVLGYTAIRAALGGILATVIVGFIQPEPGGGRLNLTKVMGALEGGSLANRVVSSSCACVGIVAGVVFHTGIGGKFGSLIFSFSAGHLLPALILAMVVAIILGMGVTVSAVYILVTLLIVPAAVQAGVAPLAAHFFVFYYAVLSHITPPVCMAAYVAAGLAEAPPLKVGFTSARLGIIGFIVPFLFVYEPSILMVGTPVKIALATITSIVGTIMIACGIQGYMVRNLRVLERLLCFTGGLLMLYPGWSTDLAGCILFGAMFLVQKYFHSSRRNSVTKISS